MLKKVVATMKIAVKETNEEKSICWDHDKRWDNQLVDANTISDLGGAE